MSSRFFCVSSIQFGFRQKERPNLSNYCFRLAAASLDVMYNMYQQEETLFFAITRTAAKIFGIFVHIFTTMATPYYLHVDLRSTHAQQQK